MKIIRNLAAHGRNLYHKYLIVPLGVWSGTKPAENMEYYLEQLEETADKDSAAERAAAYKNVIIRSVQRDQFDLTLPGNLCRDFLRDMAEWSELAYTAEANQLFSVLSRPFSEFSKYESEKLTDKFVREIAADENEEKIVAALEKTKRKNEQAINAFRAEARQKANEIASSVRTTGDEELKRSLVSYYLTFSASEIPDMHLAVNPLIEAIDRKRPGFAGEILDSVAVVIYREIMNAIQKNDLKKAIILISKYTVIFRGDPSTKYYLEVDAFERRLFDIIDKKDLWFSV